MTLVIVKADEVREGEPRFWMTRESQPFVLMAEIATGRGYCLGLSERAGPEWTHAIVDRPEPPAAPAPDPREEEVWRACFASLVATVIVASGVEDAATLADVAVREWRKRFARKEG